MKIGVAMLLVVGLSAVASGQEKPSSDGSDTHFSGLDAGQEAPAFTARDQFGHEQSNETLKGSNGTVLLFFRSADWWPFCKAQLVQLQNAKQRFEHRGIRVAAISYDSQAILKDFTERNKIEFPLLADPDSKIIRTFNVLNTEATGIGKGMAYPGFFYIDTSGTIREKYFTVKYTDRLTANNVIAKLFPELTAEVSQNIEAPHLRLTLARSDGSAIPGSRVSLIADIELPPDVHVYAPGVQKYKPIQLLLHEQPGVELKPVAYPSSKTLYLEAIREEVPVYEGKLRVTEDVTVTPSPDLFRSLPASGKTVSITAELKYQACDKTVCYTPTSVPVTWELQVLPIDRQRSPEAIQHK